MLLVAGNASLVPLALLRLLGVVDNLPECRDILLDPLDEASVAWLRLGLDVDVAISGVTERLLELLKCLCGGLVRGGIVLVVWRIVLGETLLEVVVGEDRLGNEVRVLDITGSPVVDC